MCLRKNRAVHYEAEGGSLECVDEQHEGFGLGLLNRLVREDDYGDEAAVQITPAETEDGFDVVCRHKILRRDDLAVAPVEPCLGVAHVEHSGGAP